MRTREPNAAEKLFGGYNTDDEVEWNEEASFADYIAWKKQQEKENKERKEELSLASPAPGDEQLSQEQPSSPEPIDENMTSESQTATTPEPEQSATKISKPNGKILK